MIRLPRPWRCALTLGHRYEVIDRQPYELGRGYETGLEYSECARCGALYETTGGVILSRAPRPPRGGVGGGEHAQHEE